MTSRRPGRTRELVGVLLNGLSLGVLLLIVALAAVTIVVPAAVGGMPLSVLTGSMRPNLPPGTLVVTKPTPPEEIGVGDVITYQLESGQATLVTHRVVERRVNSADGEIRFITQGDNNNTADAEPVRPVQIRGTVWYAIPYLGWVNQAVSGDTRAWAIPALAIALFIYATWTVGSGVREKIVQRRRGAGSDPGSGRFSGRRRSDAGTRPSHRA
jgi:signal peptidase